MVDNPGFITTLSNVSTLTPIDDGVDSIHSGVILAINAATGENRAIDGFNITQIGSGTYTQYNVTAGTVLRNGNFQSVVARNITTDANTGTANPNFDWYGMIVVQLSDNTLQWRHGATSTSTGKDDAAVATVARLTTGDIPVAIVKYIKASTPHNLTNRPMQFLAYDQTTRGFSAINSGIETLKINADGTLVYEGTPNDYETTLSFTDPTADRAIVFPNAGGTVALTDSNITGTAAGLSATLAVTSGGTGLTANTTWLNSQITTTATGALTYNGSTAVAVNHDSLAGFVTAEHIDWTATSAGTIDASNYTNTTYSTFDNTAAGLVPQRDNTTPLTTTKFLREDGDWVVPTDINDDVSKVNLLTRLGSYDSTEVVNIGDAGNDTTVNIKGIPTGIGTPFKN